MVTIKEYATQKGVSHQAVYKMIQTHADELEPHIIQQGRARYLTEPAIEILEKYRDTSPQIIERSTDKELIEYLRQQIREMVERENVLEREKAELSVELKDVYKKQAEDAKLIASAESNRLLLEDRTKRLEETEQLYKTEKERADALHLDLQKEQKRPLTWKERLTGRKEPK